MNYILIVPLQFYVGHNLFDLSLAILKKIYIYVYFCFYWGLIYPIIENSWTNDFSTFLVRAFSNAKSFYAKFDILIQAFLTKSMLTLGDSLSKCTFYFFTANWALILLSDDSL